MRLIALLVLMLPAPLLAQVAPLKRTPLLEQPLPASVAVHHVKAGRVEFAPGQPTGRHLHPAPVFGIVTQGSFVFQPHGQPVRTLHTGDAFYEPANTVIDHFDNASKTAPAAISAFYLLDRADEPAIRILEK